MFSRQFHSIRPKASFTNYKIIFPAYSQNQSVLSQQFVQYRSFYSSPVSPKKYLVANLLFTVSFSAAVFTIAAIVDERKRNLYSRSGFLNKIISNFPIFRSLPSHELYLGTWKRMPEHQKTILTLIAANTAVFCLSLSKSSSITLLFNKYFVSRFYSPHYTTITSSFAHSTFLHYSFNMIALYSFGTILHQVYGREQFLAFYLSASAISAHCSLIAKYFQRSFFTGSLGASGGIFSILGSLLKYKTLKVALIFVPFVHIPLNYAVYGMAAFDLYGLATGLHYFDHAAHLAGVSFGYLYHLKGRELIWERRRLYLSHLGIIGKGSRR